MQAEIKSFYCPDIDDLENYRPEIFDNFSFYLEMTIGTKGEVEGDIFGVTICTPKSFTDEFTNYDVIIPIHRVFVFKYDFHQIKTKLKHFVETRSCNNWHEIALKISKVTYWEYEDYQP